MKKNALRYLSLAAKAGKLFSGAEESEYHIRRGRGGLLVLADDAGRNVEKRASELAAGSSRVRLLKIPYTKSELSAAIGRGNTVAVVLVTDEGLAGAFADANAMEQEERI